MWEQAVEVLLALAQVEELRAPTGDEAELEREASPAGSEELVV